MLAPFLSIQSVIIFIYIIYRVNGGQRWWAFAFSGSLLLYLLFYCYLLFFTWQINSVLFCYAPNSI